MPSVNTVSKLSAQKEKPTQSVQKRQNWLFLKAVLKPKRLENHTYISGVAHPVYILS